jgi:hypothetical protein
MQIIFTPLVLFCVTEMVFVWPAAAYARLTGISHDLVPTLVVLTCSFAFLFGYLFVREADGWRTGTPSAYWQRCLQQTSSPAHLFAIACCAGLLMVLGLWLTRYSSAVGRHAFSRRDMPGSRFAAEER